jgi:hypothetical protein
LKVAARKTSIKGGPRKSAAQRSATKGTVSRDGAGTGSGGGAVDAYFASQPPDKRALLGKLRALVKKGVPGATETIKWGVPFYIRSGRNVCALAAFKEHVGLNFFGPPDAFVDPHGRLEGAGKGNRMLKVRSAADIDDGSIQRWLKAAVAASD